MSNLGNGVCDHFTTDGVVCPSNMRSGLLTAAAADNIYFNPKAAISKNSCPDISCSSIARMILKTIFEVHRSLTKVLPVK